MQQIDHVIPGIQQRAAAGRRPASAPALVPGRGKPQVHMGMEFMNARTTPLQLMTGHCM